MPPGKVLIAHDSVIKAEQFFQIFYTATIGRSICYVHRDGFSFPVIMENRKFSANIRET